MVMIITIVPFVRLHRLINYDTQSDGPDNNMPSLSLKVNSLMYVKENSDLHFSL